MTQKYQATIPKEVRKKLGIKPRDKIVFFEESPGKFTVMKEEDFVRQIAEICQDIDKTVEESKKGFSRGIKKQ